MDLVKVGQVAAEEADRQGVGLAGLIRLLEAYQWSMEMSQLIRPSQISIDMVLILAKMIEPSNGGFIRSTPVTFGGGGSSCDPREVRDVLERLLSGLKRVDCMMVDGWIEHFLWIHPFTDGNGRVAWILRVWLLGHWSSPENLPDYNW